MHLHTQVDETLDTCAMLSNSTVTALLLSAKRCNSTEIYPTRWVGNSVIHVQLAVCLYNYT